MKHLRAWFLRLYGIFPDRRREHEFAEEIESHLQMHVDDNLRRGMTPEQARREAILKLGGVEQTKEAHREQRAIPFTEHVVQDLRFAARQLLKNPGFACTAILVLALGMSASLAIFAFVDAALIKPLPYPNPTRLVSATESIPMLPQANLSYPDYLDWKKLNTVFSSLDVYTGDSFLLKTTAGTELVPAGRVSDGFFRTLGITPVLGRDFYPGEDLPDGPNTVMLTYATWQKRFGGRQDVIGQTVTLSGTSNTIVGVLPAKFQFAPRGRADFWVTLHAADGCGVVRGCHNLTGVARLKDGVSVEAAAANMRLIAAELERQYPESNRGQGSSVRPLSEIVVGDVRPILLALLSGASLLFLIACVNVASLLLVRSESRRREIAVRSALGASPGRLIRQFVTESLLLVAAAGILALQAALLVTHLLGTLIPAEMVAGMPFLMDLGLNPHVMIFACVISLLAIGLFALAPVIRLRSQDLQAGLAAGGRGYAGTVWRRFGSNLVVVELAIAMVLLVGAGLLGKSLYRLLHVELGFQPDHLATLGVVAVPETGYPKGEQLAVVSHEIVSRISNLPGVKSVATAGRLPLSGNGNTIWVRIPGQPYNGEHNEVNQRGVSSSFFTTLQARLLRGRYFTEADDASKPGVVIINQAFARKYFPGEDPLGKKIGDTDLTPKSIKEIVGMVDDIKEGSLDSETWPAIYLPENQRNDYYFSLIVRTAQDEQSVLPLLSSTIHQIDPSIGTQGESTMAEIIKDSPSAYLHRSSAWLLGGFATMALLLSIVGLYGVIAYSVGQRTREIGVRVALGAQRSAVYQLILREAGWLTALGVGAGLVGAVCAATLMRSLLFGTRAWDVSTLLAATALLAVSALLASYLPARRAASVNPAEALRAE